MRKNEITKYLKLPFQFDERRLVDDLWKILKVDWVPHFNSQVYLGKWNSIALYAPNGDHNNIFATAKVEAPILETALLQDCDYFKEVFRQFHCPLMTVRLLNLGAGASIKPHKDDNLGYENDCFRLHIPIITNAQVEFLLEDEALLMHPGECWYTNVNYTHSVANNGTEDRIHLVIDGARNDWSDDLFFSLTSKETLLPSQKSKLDKFTIARMIEELEINKPAGYKKMIKEIKKQLDEVLS